MKRDKLFGNMFMRFAACVLMAFVCAGEAWGKGAIKTEASDRFKEWSKHEVERLKAEKESKSPERKHLRSVASAGTYSETEAEQNRYGVVPSPIDNRYLTRVNKTGARASAVKYPPRYDLREKGFVTTVKDQGDYGTCWAHATIASLESWVLKKEGIEKDYSENNLANLHGFDSAYSQGGNAYMATAYLTRWGGPILEATDPYGRPGQSVSSRPDRHVQKVHVITPKKEGDNTANDEIKRAVMEYGALYVSYWADGWYFGADGVSFNSQASEYEIGLYENIYNVHYWHAVALVGWDDDYPKENFADSDYGIPAAEGNGAYIIKNSWGTVAYDESGKACPVGDEGYYYVSYYDTQFARDEIFAFASAESADNYEKVYEYDPLGYSGSLYGFESCKGWGANVFTATGDDTLAAIGFYARTPNASYSISVYTNVAANASPASGWLAATASGVADSNTAGYFTVPLDSKNEVRVKAGERFSIVMEIKTPDSRFPIPMEYVYFDTDENGQEYETFNSSVTAATGQSFFSTDGKTWYDLNSTRVNYSDGTSEFLGKYRPNVCFKAYTKSRQAPPPILTKIEIVGDSATIASGKATTFRCKATYSDGLADFVRGEWSVYPESIVTLSTTGHDCIVTADKVTKSSVIALTVTYTENGVSKSDTWNNITITVEPPPTPTGVEATQGVYADGISVDWNAVEGADEYVVSRGGEQAHEGRNTAYLARVAKPPYMDSATELIAGKTYSYFVQAVNESGKSDYSTPRAEGWARLSKPTGLLATDTLLDRIQVSWREVEGATHYRVYRAESIDGEKVPISGWIDSTKFDDNRADVGVTYLYYVAAAVDAAGSRPSDYSIFDDGIRPEPVTIDCLMIKGDESIVSGGLANYSVDAVYTDGHLAENITPDKWQIKAGGEWASVSNGRVTANTVTENKPIVLMATYADGGKTATGEKTITITAVKPSVPSGLKVVSASSAGIVLEWTAVAGAASYRIYRNDVALGTADGAATYTDKSAVPGVEYSYSVSASNGAGESGRSGDVVVTIPLAAPTGVSATNDRTDGVMVEWKPSSGASYYRVSRSTSAAGAKTQLGSWQAGSVFLDATAVAGTAYFYFVRAATTSAGGNSSDYSGYAQGIRVPTKTLAALEISGADKVASSKSTGYYCKAIYNDNTTKTVAPSWSVSPSSAATISSTGLLTAKAVSANIAATVSASFTDGVTKTATKQVTIVAPLKATAEIRNLSVASRWPFSPMIDIDYELVTQPESAKAMVSVFGRDEDHNVDMVAKTLSGDGADGSYIATGQHRLSWDIGVDYPGFHAKSFSVSITATPSIVGVPENITASESTSGVRLNWNAVEDANGYEVWRGTGSTTNGATRISTVTGGTTYADADGTVGVVYNYWLRAYTDDGFGEFAAPVAAARIAIVPTGLTINGSSSVTAGGATAYTCIVERNNGTSGAVTPVWTVSSGSEYASISSAGVLTARGIASAQSVTIKASYSQNGTTVTANKTVAINPNLVAISFDANGGMVSPASKQYVAYGTYGTLPDATRSGCVFEGWYTSVDGGVKIEPTSIVPSVMTTLHARWSLQAPADVTASSRASKSITISWTANDGDVTYQVFRSTTSNIADARKVATTTAATYADSVSDFFGNYYYWVVATLDGMSATSECVAATRNPDLLPLRNLLNLIERSMGQRDGILSDDELTLAMNAANIADMDGDPKTVSAAELAIFKRIEVLNRDKALISSVIRGDYSGIPRATMEELQDLNNEEYELTKNRNN